jgi:hypothetical protein
MPRLVWPGTGRADAAKPPSAIAATRARSLVLSRSSGLGSSAVAAHASGIVSETMLIMTIEWAGILTTAVVAIAGLVANVVISVNARHAQHELTVMAHGFATAQALRDERKDAYLHLLGTVDTWNRSLLSACRGVAEFGQSKGFDHLEELDVDHPDLPRAVAALIEAFHAVDASAVTISLAAPADVQAAAEDVRAFVEATTFSILSASITEPHYVPKTLRTQCVERMGADLGYRTGTLGGA